MEFPLPLGVQDNALPLVLDPRDHWRVWYDVLVQPFTPPETTFSISHRLDKVQSAWSTVWSENWRVMEPPLLGTGEPLSLPSTDPLFDMLWEAIQTVCPWKPFWTSQDEVRAYVDGSVWFSLHVYLRTFLQSWPDVLRLEEAHAICSDLLVEEVMKS